MLFFKSLAVLSTLAFGALSSLAAPAGTTETGLVARCDCDSLPTIIGVLKDDISVGIAAIGAVGVSVAIVAVEVFGVVVVIAVGVGHLNMLMEGIVGVGGG